MADRAIPLGTWLLAVLMDSTNIQLVSNLEPREKNAVKDPIDTVNNLVQYLLSSVKPGTTLHHVPNLTIAALCKTSLLSD